MGKAGVLLRRPFTSYI